MVELDIGIDLRLKALDQLLVAVLDRIKADIAVDIHHEVLQRIEAVGIVALGRNVRARHHLEETFGGGVIDLAVEQLFRRDVGPGVFVVVGADAFVIFDRRHHLAATLAERFDGVGRLCPVFAAHARHVIQKLAVELDLFGIHLNRLQAEMLDQLAQGIRAGHRVVVDFGNAGFVDRGCRIEAAGEDLAPQPIRRFKNGDAAQVAQLPFEVPRTHQAARPAAYNR